MELTTTNCCGVLLFHGGGGDAAQILHDVRLAIYLPAGSSSPVRYVCGLGHLGVLGVKHPPNVPELHRLVLPVRDEVVPVTLGRDARHPRLVPAETPHLFRQWLEESCVGWLLTLLLLLLLSSSFPHRALQTSCAVVHDVPTISVRTVGLTLDLHKLAKKRRTVGLCSGLLCMLLLKTNVLLRSTGE